eukprot:12784321-Ditylum_brightwellii.AAC.1
MAGNMEGNITVMPSHHQVTLPQTSGVSTNEEAKEEDTASVLQSVMPETEPQPEDDIDLQCRSV